MHVNSKVFFLKLRTYHNKLKKGLKVGDGKRCFTQSGSSPHSTEIQEADVSSKHLAETEEHDDDETMAGVSETNDDSLYSIVTPDSIPISMWIKNMSTLLMSDPWLTEDHLRREAVCTLLGLDNTLLDRRHSDILQNWVVNNRTIVETLKRYGLQESSGGLVRVYVH